VVDCGVVQEGQVSHIVAFLILWRVHLQQLVALECDRLALSGHEGDIVSLLGSNLGALVTFFFAWHKEVLG